MNTKENFNIIDQKIAKGMGQIGIPTIRIVFAIIFIWFGVLKPFGLSAAAPLLKATVTWLPFGNPENWLIVIGWWEVIIGITFLFKRTTRIAIGLLFLQMIGTLMPLMLLPDVVYQNGNSIYLPTIEGQYIIKNLMIIAASLVVGGTIYKPKLNT